MKGRPVQGWALDFVGREDLGEGSQKQLGGRKMEEGSGGSPMQEEGDARR